MTNKERMIWTDMARRKVRFHTNQEWNTLRLWLLAFPSDVKKLTEAGLLIPYGREMKRCQTWYYPSPEAWNKYIKPLIDAYSLDELTKMLGW